MDTHIHEHFCDEVTYYCARPLLLCGSLLCSSPFTFLLSSNLCHPTGKGKQTHSAQSECASQEILLLAIMGPAHLFEHLQLCCVCKDFLSTLLWKGVNVGGKEDQKKISIYVSTWSWLFVSYYGFHGFIFIPNPFSPPWPTHLVLFIPLCVVIQGTYSARPKHHSLPPADTISAAHQLSYMCVNVTDHLGSAVEQFSCRSRLNRFSRCVSPHNLILGLFISLTLCMILLCVRQFKSARSCSCNVTVDILLFHLQLVAEFGPWILFSVGVQPRSLLLIVMCFYVM